MKKTAMVLAVVVAFGLTGCGAKKVPEYEYQKVIQERDQYKEKYMGVLEEQTKAAEAQRPLSYAEAWVKASFGDSAAWSIVGGNYLQVIVPTLAPLTADQVEASVKQYQAAVNSLAGMQQVNPEHFEFSVVLITYLDDSGSEVFTLQIRKGDKGFEADTKSVKEAAQAIVREGVARVQLPDPVGQKPNED